MAGSGQSRPPDTNQKVVFHPQVGGRASGSPSNAIDLIFPPLLNTFPFTPFQPQGKDGRSKTQAAPRVEATQFNASQATAEMQPKAPTFAAVTKDKGERRFPPIHLTARQYGRKEGKPSISFSTAELQVGIDNLKHSLVAKFSGGRPPIEEVRGSLLQAWGLQGSCSIGAWDARHVLIVLESEMEARKVLAHPCRKIGHSLFRVFRWSSEFDTRTEPTTTTVWVRLVKLPPQLYNQGYMESIVSSFGRFLAVDNKTATFINPSFARVCIEMDVANPPPNEVWIATGPEAGFWLKLIFENSLLYCSKCRLHGHHLETCRKVKQQPEEEQKIWETRDEDGLPPKGSYPQPAQGDRHDQRNNTQTAISINEPTLLSKESGDQGWQVVRNRKQKKKAMKHNKAWKARQSDNVSTCKPEQMVPYEVHIPVPEARQGDPSTSNKHVKDHITHTDKTVSNIKQSALPTRNALESSKSRQNSNSDQKTKSDRSMALVVFNENNEDGRQVVAEVKPTQPLAAIEPSCELEKDLIMHGSPPINGEKEDEEYEVNNHIGLVHESSPFISILSRTRHRKNALNEPQRVIRSSARSCPKKKDSIFFWS